MLNLHVVQAAFGDCLLLEYGTEAAPRYVLIDGGPPTNFTQHLEPVLQRLKQEGAPLDLVVLSHVDNDHVVGLLEYFTALQISQANLPKPGGLWHNSFRSTVDPRDVIQPRLAALMTPSRVNIMAEAGMAVQGVSEGANLRAQALILQLPINENIPGGLISVDNVPNPLNFGNMELVVVGPTQANLDELAEEWLQWLENNEDSIATGTPMVLANSDRSIPNLSSIMLLARSEGRTMLLTGDGRSDHLLAGLTQAGLLDDDGKLHVDVLKLPHHGSDRNMTQAFFRKVTADTYVISADGKDGNPDLATLIWLVKAAKEQERPVKLVATNQTISLSKLMQEYPADDYGYTLEVLDPNESVITV